MNAAPVVPVDIETSMTPAEGVKLAGLADGDVVLELGAWQGFSTVCLAQNAEFVLSVDWHQGDAHAGYGSTLVPYLQNLQRFGLLAGERVAVHVGRFEHLCSLLADQSFDGVFVDGLHDYASVRRDADQAKRLARDWVAFHDYGVEAVNADGLAFGVAKAVTEVFGEPTEIVDTLAIVRVRDAGQE